MNFRISEGLSSQSQRAMLTHRHAPSPTPRRRGHGPYWRCRPSRASVAPDARCLTRVAVWIRDGERV
eukprot:1440448-Prymnesium_polylepis.1